MVLVATKPFYHWCQSEVFFSERENCSLQHLHGNSDTITVRERSFGKVMFSQACVKDSAHRGGGGVHAHGRHPPRADTSPLRTVRILLECILVRAVAMVTHLVTFPRSCRPLSASLSCTRTPPVVREISATSRRRRLPARAASVLRDRSGWWGRAPNAGCSRTFAACPSGPRSEPQVQGQPSSYLGK